MRFPACVSVLREREKGSGLVVVYGNDTRVSKDAMRERNGETENEMQCECVCVREKERGEGTRENAN